MQQIGSLPFGLALSVSDDGYLVVGVYGNNARTAFLWHPAIGVVSLENYLQSRGVDLTGWSLDSVADLKVSGNGRFVVGGASFNGSAAAFIADIGVITPWESPCSSSDLFVDHQVNGADLGILLSQWGLAPAGTVSDINRDGLVNGADLGYLLNAWGPCSATITVPTWATLVEAMPDPAVVTDTTLRSAIAATGLAWRVRDTATQMEMSLVPPGAFVMGCTASNEHGCNGDESPTHSVTLTRALYMGRHEVTQGQWVAKMGSNPSYFQGQSDSASRPVEQVSWNTIQGYLSVTGMRLPSEAEWEYACRAGTTTAFNNGSNDDNTVGNIAWWNGNSGNQTHAVGGKAANALGLHDMTGNVWEWVNDWSEGYSSGGQTNPAGPVSGSYRVVRGGSWNNITYNLRSSYRPYNTPDFTYNFIGFRVARNP
jgi:formylglycine-generating enzyme required for sulfatase activity